MRIDKSVLTEMPIAIDNYGDKVATLLNLGVSLRDQPFAIIEKKLLGAKGEIFTTDRFIKFKANRGFSKLKEQEVVNYSDVTEFHQSNASTWLNCEFKGASGKFEVGLVFYGMVKALPPRDVFWYQVDDFPSRSAAFYKLLKVIVPGSGFTHDLKASSLKNRLENAIEFFEGNRRTEDMNLNLANVVEPGFFVLQQAFSLFLAGTTLANHSNRDNYLEVYRSLDNIYVRILRKLMVECNETMGNIFNREKKIYEADEKFQKLSSLWYLRQIASLHFASKYLPKEETRVWPMKVLKPRARIYRTNTMAKLQIKLPTPEEYEEAIAHFKLR